jgi:hypothetical protein
VAVHSKTRAEAFIRGFQRFFDIDTRIVLFMRIILIQNRNDRMQADVYFLWRIGRMRMRGFQTKKSPAGGNACRAGRSLAVT